MLSVGIALAELLLLAALGLGMKELGIKPSAVFKAGLAKLKSLFKRS